MALSKKMLLGLLTVFNVGALYTQVPFATLINETNTFLAHYDTLNAFDHERFIPLEASGLPPNVVATLKADKNDVYGLSEDRMAISEDALIMELQELIIDNLNKMTAHVDFARFQPQQLIENDVLAVVVSPDRKLYHFSLDEKTGGTYRSRLVLTHYTDLHPTLLPTPEELASGTKPDPYDLFVGDGFHDIDTINTATGVKYVLQGAVRGCSYCFESNIMLAQMTEQGFRSDFYYSVNSRGWEGGIDYNPSTKAITVNYETDDLTADCSCENAAADDYYEYDDASLETVKRCHCTFIFDGKNFELVKESWEKVRE